MKRLRAIVTVHVAVRLEFEAAFFHRAIVVDVAFDRELDYVAVDGKFAGR